MWHVVDTGFRFGGVTEASLTSDCLLHACCSIHGGGWLGLVHQPEVKEFASFESCSHRYPEKRVGDGGGGANRSAKGGVGWGRLEGSERPEAG